MYPKGGSEGFGAPAGKRPISESLLPGDLLEAAISLKGKPRLASGGHSFFRCRAQAPTLQAATTHGILGLLPDWIGRVASKGPSPGMASDSTKGRAQPPTITEN